MTKTLEYYLSLRYDIYLEGLEEGGYAATIPLLKGCMSDGETPVEAVTHLEEAKVLWLEVALESKMPIPEPQYHNYTKDIHESVERLLEKERTKA
ncbi:MAG: type II toxin-antitoxin system HicB family antitoxin [Chloroflexi bacterium]|nr:type II toxin-antitoxin system HicB family antitoxin [Chloroflexota bacterium]MCC6897213.1 type II toxin-antitoxin system HicB family antitoxin [Anaerolineae bacterium]